MCKTVEKNVNFKRFDEENKWSLVYLLPFISGSLMSLNFAVFWAIPVAGMGSFYKIVLKPYLQPIYSQLEANPAMRKFAADYVYTKPEHADFFPMCLLLLVNCSISISFVFYWQLTRGHLPFWLIFAYYCSWVGLGGSIMGSAYAFAHKEGHNHKMYQKWIKGSIGNFFENWLGIFFGNVPYNFTTSHIFIHHTLNGGIGDTFYCWDIDRSNIADFMRYVHRIFLHMTGYTSLRLFQAQGMHSKANLLRNGMICYAASGVAILLLTRSFAFLFWIFLQPLLCMSYFLALINIGFHGFIEYDENGTSIQCVNSTTIVDGEDDMFGEDDHMTHHYNSNVYYRDLKQHQNSKIEEFKKYKASVFQKLSVAELSIFVIFGLWDKLADHYVDYTGLLTREEIKTMLRTRATRLETSYGKYEQYLLSPTADSKKQLVEMEKTARLRALKSCKAE